MQNKGLNSWDFWKYEEIGAKHKFDRSKFLVDIPLQMNPFSQKYKAFWKDQKRKCIEGFWYEGKFMPGNLYFYVNFTKIELIMPGKKGKQLGRPFLRDIEWETAYVYLEAKGFSGFEKDDTVTCLHIVKELNELKQKDKEAYNRELELVQIPKSAYKKDGTFKSYVHPRDYIRRTHPKNYGKPLFGNNAKNVIDIRCRRIGKDLEESTLLHYIDGSKRPIKDVKVGDIIFGGDGKPTKVLERMDFNDQLQYEVTLRDGRKVICGGGHLWTVYKRGKKETLTLDQIKEHYYYNRSDGRKEFKYCIPENKVVEYSGEDPNIDPYYLGLWLGDGTCRDTGITTMDDEIIAFLEELRIKEGLSTLNCNRKLGNKAATYTLTNGKIGVQNKLSNPLLDKLRELGVLNNKHIPTKVLNASKNYRLAVLQGLMDSDGSCSGVNSEISTSYTGLQKDLPILLYGLGIKHKCNLRKTTHKDSLRITLYTDLKLFRLSRKNNAVKKANEKTKYSRSKVAIVNIKPLEVKPSVCIKVDNKDSLFLVNDFVVTHNSWGSAGMLGLHNFVFDGAIDYDDYLESNKAGDPLTSETLIGAIDSKYSSDLVKKVQTGMANLAGDLNFNGIEYPSPFAKQTVGSLQPSKTMIAQFQQKLDGGWVTKGSNSKIHHRTFGDNPLAGNGTSPNLIILEEVGFFSNIIDTIAALKDATMDGLNKFGVIYMCGTSGDVGAGLSEGTQDIFFNPEKYDCLSFNDIWEDTGQVGFFVPYQFKFDEYRDDNGIVDIHKAEEIIGRKRKVLFEQRDIRKYMTELQNNPSTPSEAFITQDGNTFPTADLKEQKGFVLSKMKTDSFYKGECGELVYDPLNKHNVKWVPDLKGKLVPCKYNMQKTDDTTGCIQIWEHPVKDENGEVPWGLYLAGNDPYDQDQSTTASLGSTFIYKTYAGIDSLNHRIVAEYTARPETAKQHHENVLKLLMYYNAQCLYENERNTIMMHFRQRNKAHYMVAQPDVLKSLENTSVKRDKGVHMTASIKKDMIDCLNDWLVDEDQHGRMNLNNIYSIPLLDELINYNETGNFDRVIALLLTITLKNQNHKIRVDLRKKKTVDPFFSDLRKFFKNE